MTLSLGGTPGTATRPACKTSQWTTLRIPASSLQGQKALGGAFSQVPVRSYVPQESQYPAYFSVLAEDKATSEPTTNTILTYVKTTAASHWKLASSSQILGPTSAGVGVRPAAVENRQGQRDEPRPPDRATV